MYSCPACGTEEIAARTTCLCGADLTLLRRLDEVVDAWFNRALEAAAADAPGRALEWLSACCVARPTDAVARRAQAKVWAQLNCWTAAAESLALAAAIEPDAPELAALRQALDAERQPRPAISGAGKKKPGKKRTPKQRGSKRAKN